MSYHPQMTEAAGAKLDFRGARQNVGDEHVIRRNRVLLQPVMLPDPSLLVPDPVATDHYFQVLPEAIGAIALWRMQRLRPVLRQRR